MVSRDPCRLGEFELGYARLGVYHAGYWELMMKPHAGTVTWRVANINVDRDTTTGHRVPDYSLTHSIKGVFEDVGGTLLPLPPGFTQTGDAVFRCMDGIRALDQIYRPENQRFYEVGYVHEHYEYLEQQDVQSFCYRIGDLTYLPLFKEG